MWCYCSICRKTAGGGGYAINIMGKADTLKTKGRTKVYRAMRGGGERHFCPKCASALWVRDKRWPEWIYPFASAIDTLGFPTLADRRPDPLSLVITEPSQSNSTGFAYLNAGSAGTALSQADSILQDALENMQTMRAKSGMSAPLS